ncbi:alpha/beta hydrolase [uncultured Parvibaculum sp.]|uniref:alpha/beta fold hydrolase n=1 Tax=uncultured Parvibaculum sp. TaxID=291828 RepID=UPI0030D9B48B|tara:strand:+ start:149955 stop:150866 length:912 start_codon:yes stop_codon:yes gene_type:complete
MPQVKANGIEIEYESFGPADRDAVLLIMGFSAQLTMWPTELCEELVSRGYRVIRYDNRDVGLSAKLEAKGVPDMEKLFGALMTGAAVEAPYSLDDMAADAAGLLDALKIERAHIVGASMGGMIAQLVAANHPEKTLSLTSIMSNTGNPDLPQGSPEAMGALMAPAPAPDDIEAIVARGINTWKVIGSPGYPTDDQQLRQWVMRDAKRSYYPQGVTRQFAAIVANGDRRPKLKNIKAPTVVLHGADDPLVPVAGGKDTADNIPGAELRVIPGMGHDFPLGLVPVFADAIEAAARRAAGAARAAD